MSTEASVAGKSKTKVVLDLICTHCGWKCDSCAEALTAGDRCPMCEEECPGDEGFMEWIYVEDSDGR